MIESIPLISCLCVTNRRVPQLKISVDCFLAQTYPNKEMVIVCQENDPDTVHFIESLNRKDIVLVRVSPPDSLTLGELRNLSLEHSSGEYFCQWDDDDWSHRDRLMIQFQNVTRNVFPSTMLMNVLMFDAGHVDAYFSYFRLWDQTILGKRELFNAYKYKPLNKSEDREFSHLLMTESRVFPTVAPNLYIYVYHGNNTWGSEHFNWLFEYAQKLPDHISILIRDIIKGNYSVDEASNLLNSIEVMGEINYFWHEAKLIRQKMEEDKLQQEVPVAEYAGETR
ncbi:MAG: glycosyltransferase family A protein [Chitinophagaceae bacterium]